MARHLLDFGADRKRDAASSGRKVFGYVEVGLVERERSMIVLSEYLADLLQDRL
jgi:hypothetical protein